MAARIDDQLWFGQFLNLLRRPSWGNFFKHQSLFSYFNYSYVGHKQVYAFYSCDGIGALFNYSGLALFGDMVHRNYQFLSSYC